MHILYKHFFVPCPISSVNGKTVSLVTWGLFDRPASCKVANDSQVVCRFEDLSGKYPRFCFESLELLTDHLVLLSRAMAKSQITLSACS
jgi:hypothetical protein